MDLVFGILFLVLVVVIGVIVWAIFQATKP